MEKVVLEFLKQNLSPGSIAALVACACIIWVTWKVKGLIDSIRKDYADLIAEDAKLRAQNEMQDRRQKKIIKIICKCAHVPRSALYWLANDNLNGADIPKELKDDGDK